MNKRLSSTFRVDEQVYITMGILCIVALITLAFRYATSHPCSPIALQINANAFVEGNVITFKANTTNSGTFSWNFGDNTSNVDEHESSATHVYKNAGKYTVTVTVNGECTDMQNVVITEAPVVINNSLQIFDGPDTAYVNQPVSYEDMSLNSTSWEWYFEDAGTLDSKTRKATHTYTTAGPKNILLRVNGKADLVVHRLIFVIDKDAQKRAAREARTEAAPKPKVMPLILPPNPTTAPLPNPSEQPKKPEEKPKMIEVSHEQIEGMLMDVVDGNKKPDDFSPYLCGGNVNTPVSYNSGNITFSALCQELKGLKKKKIKKITVLLFKSEATGCITSMSVTVEKKKGFLGL